MKRTLIATAVAIGIVTVVVGGWWAIYAVVLNGDPACGQGGCTELF